MLYNMCHVMLYNTGTAEGEGLVGPRPHHFLAPRPHFWKIKYYDFIPFFDFQYEKIIFNCQPSHFSPCSAVPVTYVMLCYITYVMLCYVI